MEEFYFDNVNPYDTVFDFWNASELVEPDYRKDHATITLAIFSDSSWRDEKSTRKSTNSGMIFMNGCLIHSICRSQDTIALSSCEAELYAANTTMVESIYLYQLILFLMSDESPLKQGCLWTRLQKSLWYRGQEWDA